MKYTFTLQDPQTDEVVEYKEDYDWEDEGTMLFQWTENNYSCDCNRSMFMYEHKEEYSCGDTIRLLRITREDGTEVDFEED